MNHETTLASGGTTKATDPGGNAPFGALAASLILLMAILAGGSARRESATMDEVVHVGAGVSYLQKRDLRLNLEHPPLAKMIAALPLAATGVHADYSSIEWTISQQVFPGEMAEGVFGDRVLTRWNDTLKTLERARATMLLLTLVLAATVYLCAKRIGGGWGGILCLAVFASTPTFLAFGPLVLTDIPVALFSLLALWTFAEVWRDPSGPHVRLFGLSLAGALLSKFSAGLLFFAFLAFALSTLWRPLPGQPGERRDARAWRGLQWRATLRGILLAAVIVYAFYLVFSWNQPPDFWGSIGGGFAAAALRRLFMPAKLYLEGVYLVLLTANRPTFILGHAYPHGVWFYFPVLFALKSPLGFLGLLLEALGAAWLWKNRNRSGAAAIPEDSVARWRMLWVSLIVFTLACVLGKLDISIRHFTIPMVLLTLLLAPLPRILEKMRADGAFGPRAWEVVAALLAISCLVTAVRAYPYYIPYVNALSFGRPAYALMNDSNVDWGQALPEVRSFAVEHGLQTINLDAYVIGETISAVPQSKLWNCQTPVASDGGQWVAVSANFILDAHNCSWLMRYPREALGGGSMYVFRLPPQIPPAGTPGGPPLPSDYRQIAGAPFDIRIGTEHLIDHPEDIPEAVAKSGFRGHKVN
ncbi:MAG TPA: glycosyltransferase family 39 protein [Candidatus Limnocylindrales bacterium]|nr:glycosyltransferase family 39 protein [Candidatus Limnocylindrales bacterium]